MVGCGTTLEGRCKLSGAARTEESGQVKTHLESMYWSTVVLLLEWWIACDLPGDCELVVEVPAL